MASMLCRNVINEGFLWSVGDGGLLCFTQAPISHCCIWINFLLNCPRALLMLLTIWACSKYQRQILDGLRASSLLLYLPCTFWYFPFECLKLILIESLRIHTVRTWSVAHLLEGWTVLGSCFSYVLQLTIWKRSSKKLRAHCQQCTGILGYLLMVETLMTTCSQKASCHLMSKPLLERQCNGHTPDHLTCVGWILPVHALPKSSKCKSGCIWRTLCYGCL